MLKPKLRHYLKDEHTVYGKKKEIVFTCFMLQKRAVSASTLCAALQAKIWTIKWKLAKDWSEEQKQFSYWSKGHTVLSVWLHVCSRCFTSSIWIKISHLNKKNIKFYAVIEHGGKLSVIVKCLFWLKRWQKLLTPHWFQLHPPV